MTLRNAVRTTLGDWLRVDREMPRWLWVVATIAIAPAIPLVIAYRLTYEEKL